jgi:hypothetical protein
MALGSGRSNARLGSGKLREGDLAQGLTKQKLSIWKLSSRSSVLFSGPQAARPVGPSDSAEKVGERRSSTRDAGRIAEMVLEVGFHAISLCNSC